MYFILDLCAVALENPSLMDGEIPPQLIIPKGAPTNPHKAGVYAAVPPNQTPKRMKSGIELGPGTVPSGVAAKYVTSPVVPTLPSKIDTRPPKEKEWRSVYSRAEIPPKPLPIIPRPTAPSAAAASAAAAPLSAIRHEPTPLSLSTVKERESPPTVRYSDASSHRDSMRIVAEKLSEDFNGMDLDTSRHGSDGTESRQSSSNNGQGSGGRRGSGTFSAQPSMQGSMPSSPVAEAMITLSFQPVSLQAPAAALVPVPPAGGKKSVTISSPKVSHRPTIIRLRNEREASASS